ncbi:hypothetical protein [Nitratireductor sp. StC3]|uniref:hypothetical protein n=1 Tax=Nitratireductor sp. StC3 TaxID=2126741 RepID=UPI0011B29386|nr:hypothetical protein [Nitratireductor sp. StC3]
MELKNFVKVTLNDIMDAIQETIAEREEANKKGFVNPKTHGNNSMEIDTIRFDIAISVGDTTKAGGQAGIQILAAKLGGEAGHEHEKSSVSRIEFTLGVAWPHTHIEDAKKLVRAK